LQTVGPTNDTATVTVVPISVNCLATLTSAIDVGGSCTVTLPANTVGAPVHYTLSIGNPSAVDLNVTINNLPAGLFDCNNPATPVVVSQPILVPANTTNLVVDACFAVSCPGGEFRVQVKGTAVPNPVVAPC